MIRRGETLIEVLMTYVVPVIGMSVLIAVLRHFTALPFWACALIGIPVGTIAAWLLVLGALYMFALFFRNRTLPYGEAKRRSDR